MQPTGVQKAPYINCYKEPPPLCPRLRDIKPIVTLQWRENSSNRPFLIEEEIQVSGPWKRQHWALSYCPILCLSMGWPNFIKITALLWFPEKEEGVAPALIYTSSYWIFSNLSHNLDTTLKGRRLASVPILQHESLTQDEMTNNFGKNGTWGLSRFCCKEKHMIRNVASCCCY